MVRRFLQAVVALTPLFLVHVRDRRRFLLFGGPRELSHEDRVHRAEAVAEAFEDLGTTYIKLAQFLTTRPDLVPPVYVQAMERLQDEVPPEEYSLVHQRLEEEIGDPDRVFDSFEEEPLAGASIAQVHRAVYRGDEVVLKIRRPGLEDVVKADLSVIRFLAPFVQWFLRYLGQESHAESAESIVDELERTIREEMDFDREAEIMTEIRRNFERDGLDNRVIIPEAYPEVSTEKVLTMSYEEGIAVKHTEEIERQGHDVEEVVDALADAYLHMAFKHDVFQADPHQGNLAVAPDGRVVIYDYGISQRPDPEVQRKWTRMFMGVGLRDPEMVVEAVEDMGALAEDVPRSVLYDATEMMIRDVSGGDVDAEEMQEIERRIDETLYDYPLRFPQEVILGMRANFGLDGLCASLAPDYDFSRKLYEFFVDEMDAETLPRFQEMNDSRGYRALDRVDESLDRLDLPLPYLKGNRPLTSFLLDLHRWLGVDLSVFRQPPEVARDRSGDEEPSLEEVKNELTRRSRENDRRTLQATLGASFLVAGTVLYTADSIFALPSMAVGVLFFLLTWLSLRSGDRGVLGPKYVATRHRIQQWEDEGEDADEAGKDGENVSSECWP